MRGVISFFTEGGWKKLPWKNSWFSLAFFSTMLSGLLLVMDFTGGMPKPHGNGAPASSAPAANNDSNPAPPPSAPSTPSTASSPFSFPKLPFFEQPGSLTVTASPANASVHVKGQSDQTAPANFPKVSVGHYEVTVSAPGYDSATQTVEIRESQPASLDFVLQRTTGTLNLTTIPPHVTFSVKPAGGSDDDAKGGKTPVNGLALPGGDYEVSLDSPRDGSLTRTITVTGHQASSQTIDLVLDNAARDAGAGAAGALRGQTDPSTLNEADKSEYIEKLNGMITEYTRVGAFSEAQGAIDHLNTLKQNTQAQAQHLTEMRTGYEQKISDSVKDLVSQGQLGAARSKLKAAEDDVPDDVANRLNTDFTPSLAGYASQIDTAVASANAGDPQAGYASLQTLAQQHPDDVTVALAMSHLLTKMPFDHDHVSAQLEALQKFNAPDLASNDATDLQQMESKLQNALKTYDRLKAAVDQEKEASSPGGNSERVAELSHQIARDRASVAAASGVNNTIDTLTTGFLHTHVRVVDVSAKEDEIARDEARIRDLQDTNVLSKGPVSPAEQSYNAFCSQAPW